MFRRKIICQKMFSVQNIFLKNDFMENIFRCLVRTKNIYIHIFIKLYKTSNYENVPTRS